jgi:hypothetical protein
MSSLLQIAQRPGVAAPATQARIPLGTPPDVLDSAEYGD